MKKLRQTCPNLCSWQVKAARFKLKSVSFQSPWASHCTISLRVCCFVSEENTDQIWDHFSSEIRENLGRPGWPQMTSALKPRMSPNSTISQGTSVGSVSRWCELIIFLYQGTHFADLKILVKSEYRKEFPWQPSPNLAEAGKMLQT